MLGTQSINLYIFYYLSEVYILIHIFFQSYVLMSLDAHTIDLGELRYGLSNVTCLRIFDHSDSRTKSYLADWKTRGSADVRIPRQTHEITVSFSLR